MSDLVIVVGIWVVLLVSLHRAWQRHRLGNQQALLIWRIYLFAGCTFIFRVPALETLINAHFQRLPMVYGIKSLFILLAIQQYHCFLQRILPDRFRHWRLLFVLTGGVLWLNVSLFAAAWLGWLTSLQAYFSLMTLTDLVAFVHLVTVFLPANLWLFRTEQLLPMRIKHFALLVFCCFYAVSAGLTQLLGPYTVITGHITPLHYLVPLAPIMFVCFLVLAVPHRSLHRFLLLHRVGLLWRLQRLEKQVLVLSGREVPPPIRCNPLNEKQVQTALYRTCVRILDYSPIASQKSVSGQSLHRRIMQAAQLDANYETLLTALGRLV